jgi:hypothetical protein
VQRKGRPTDCRLDRGRTRPRSIETIHPTGIEARRTTLLGGLALSAATVVALWLLAEIVLRVFFDGVAPPLRLAYADIGETYTPSYRGSMYDPESGRAVPMRTNALGFRGPDRPERKPDGVRRIAVLGDSMVAGLAVPEAETMCGVVEALLNADAGGAPRTEVMNFGVAASGPAQELALYRGLVRRFAPDVVVLTFFYGNDLSDTLYEISDRYGRMYLELDDAGTLRPRPYVESPLIARWLAGSRLFAWIRLLTGKAGTTARRPRQGSSPSALGYLPDGDPRAERAWRLLDAIVAELARDVRADGGRLVALAIPSSREIYRDDAALREWAGPVANVIDLDVQERRMTRLCERLRVPFVSLKPAFLADAAEPEPLYLARVGHLTAHGHRVAAVVVADRLRAVP